MKKLTLFLLFTVLAPIACLDAVYAESNLTQARDIVEQTLAGNTTGQDTVKLSFIILDKKGNAQMERAAHFAFYTGEMFRAKIVSSQSGTLQLSNIGPTGKVTQFRPIPVQAGATAYYPPETSSVLQFADSTGNETLRVTFTPNNISTQTTPAPVSLPAPIVGSQDTSTAPPALTRPSEFFSGVQGKAYFHAKDIKEIVIETADNTILTRPTGTGILQFDVFIQHQ